jgi:lipopolysaccharide transport system ATP-binding protein
MRKKEITRKFDEIVDFSGVERYIDTPVKRYSSGMYVRLAFAVAAHLESEILIVDEVLAVGDAEFQAKCLGKMGEVSKGQGRTVLFVSHNLPSIVKLCKKSILINNGILNEFDLTIKVINKYQFDTNSVVISKYVNNIEVQFTENFKISNSSFFIFISLKNKLRDSEKVIVNLKNEDNVVIFRHEILGLINCRSNKIKLKVLNPRLMPGCYYIETFVSDNLNLRYIENRVQWNQFNIDYTVADYLYNKRLIFVTEIETQFI